MDIWGWVNGTAEKLRESGHQRLAMLMWNLPGAVVDDDHARTDAMVPEALALARAARAPWVELFVRHWSLQSRVLHRGEGTSALSEAVSLLEFAHRDDTKECPQAVCAVQDLCSCYGYADGAGYAPERIAVATETLKRIDPSWPCWSCVTGELASALMNAGRAQEAFDEVERGIAAQLATGSSDALWDFEITRADALIVLGRHAEALEMLDRGVTEGRDALGHNRHRNVLRALALARLGRIAEAAEVLPPAADIAASTPTHEDWIDTVTALIDAGVVENNLGIGQTIAGFVQTSEKNGAPRKAFTVAEKGLALAVRRGALRPARELLGAMERAIGALRVPLDAPARLEAARGLVAGIRVELPDTVDGVMAALEGERTDPEVDLSMLDAAVERWPREAGLAAVRAAALLSSGRAGEALESMRPWLTPDADGQTIAVAVEAAVVVGDGSIEPALRASGDPSMADWMLARILFGRQDWPGAIRHLAAVLESNPEALNTRRLWAAAARAMGDHATSLSRLDEVVARAATPGDHWDRIVSATIEGAWGKVRESAAAVGMELGGEGAIDEVWGPCKVRFPDDERWALRTGPVTARVVEIGRSMERQHFRDAVVFDPRPLNQPEGERPVFEYRLVKVMQPGRCWSFEVDGVRPDNWEAIEAMLDAFGGECRVLSGDEYQAGGRPGVYAVVAVPEGVDPLSVHISLERATDGTLTWLSLAERVGDPSVIARQEQVAEELGL